MNTPIGIETATQIHLKLNISAIVKLIIMKVNVVAKAPPIVTAAPKRLLFSFLILISSIVPPLSISFAFIIIL